VAVRHAGPAGESRAYGIERWRSLRGRCLGSVIWQLNDCWPVTSWAALDLGTNAAGEPVARRKPLWYAVRSAYADHLITVQHDEAGWRAVLVNDGTDTWAATGTIEVRALDGEVLYSEALDETLAPRSRKDLPLTDLPALDRTDVAIVVTAKGAERAVKLLVETWTRRCPSHFSRRRSLGPPMELASR